MYRHYDLVSSGGCGHVLRCPLHGIATQEPTSTTTIGSDATYPHAPTSDRDRGRTPGDHHRDQQPTPTTPRPGSTSRNLPTPHTTTPPQCCTSDSNTG